MACACEGATVRAAVGQTCALPLAQPGATVLPPARWIGTALEPACRAPLAMRVAQAAPLALPAPPAAPRQIHVEFHQERLRQHPSR